MRKFKTADKNRTNYVYYTEEGKKIVLTPEDVDSTWIALLHDEDDEFVDADRRENEKAERIITFPYIMIPILTVKEKMQLIAMII